MKILLSKLVCDRQNPRRVKPEREAHRRLVASIRTFGLLEPLLVRPDDGDKYKVIAGGRRLVALREVHRGDDPAIDCIRKQVDAEKGAAIGLAENFAREPMHPLDEAEAFAHLAKDEGEGVASIAEQFGVTENYVRQRMKLAGLAEVVKVAFRDDEINVAIAAAFAAVPPERQKELWKEVNGKPMNAEQIRDLIENEWIDARLALFDLATIDSSAISQDLFGGAVLVERKAFMNAQTAVLQGECKQLEEDGWSHAVFARRKDTPELLHDSQEAMPKYDPKTAGRLKQIQKRRQKLENATAKNGDEENRIATRLDELDEREQCILANASSTYSESVKATGTAFILLAPDGSVERFFRVPRSRGKANGRQSQDAEGQDQAAEHSLPTSNDLSASQLAQLYTVETLVVREALAKDRIARKRLLVLALHPKVSTDAVAVSRNANFTSLHATNSESFKPQLHEVQQSRLNEIDPFKDQTDEVKAYKKLSKLSEKELDALIGVLIADVLTGHAQRSTPLIRLLALELGVSLREQWRPDAAWLGGYQKAHLAHLTGELRGPAHGSAGLSRKKSELVGELSALFERAAINPQELEDSQLAERLNTRLPKPLLESTETPVAS